MLQHYKYANRIEDFWIVLDKDERTCTCSKYVGDASRWICQETYTKNDFAKQIVDMKSFCIFISEFRFSLPF